MILSKTWKDFFLKFSKSSALISTILFATFLRKDFQLPSLVKINLQKLFNQFSRRQRPLKKNLIRKPLFNLINSNYLFWYDIVSTVHISVIVKGANKAFFLPKYLLLQVIIVAARMNICHMIIQSKFSNTTLPYQSKKRSFSYLQNKTWLQAAV